MTIASLIPQDLKDLLSEIEGLGFSLCLVGGAPRDFFMNHILSHDLDFEIRNLEASALREFFKSKNIFYTELPYQITRVNVFGHDLEFSTPRLERQIDGNKTHHHFEAELDSKLSYVESFKRRDFTLNAIGVELDLKHIKELVVDPYGGVKDLEAKTLREISEDFFLDSVRFLRLIRFSIKYQFSISDSITKKIHEFDLSELSRHHFVEEMMKSKAPGPFINKFNEMVTTFNLSIPTEFTCWSGLTFSDVVKTKDDVLVAAFLQNASAAQLVSAFFLMPEKRIKDLSSFYDSLNKVLQASREDFLCILQKPLNELTAPGLLKELKNLEEKKEWRVYFDEKLLLSWSDWEDVIVESAELESTPAPMRSYVKFYKALGLRFKS